ncbi:MAG: hypothetical protein ACK5LO_17495 [Leucobacter sp.]
MENNTQYSAEAALNDVAATRSQTRTETAQSWPARYSLMLAAVIPIASLGFVASSPWSYLFPLVGILLAVIASIRMASAMDRRGVQLRAVDELRRSPLAIVGLSVSALVFFLSMPLTDINGWNPWTVPAAGLACGVIWLVLLLAVGRSFAARIAEDAR